MDVWPRQAYDLLRRSRVLALLWFGVLFFGPLGERGDVDGETCVPAATSLG
jgi:hypothetical protein